MPPTLSQFAIITGNQNHCLFHFIAGFRFHSTSVRRSRSNAATQKSNSAIQQYGNSATYEETVHSIQSTVNGVAKPQQYSNSAIWQFS
jgi:hypothetical protein